MERQELSLTTGEGLQPLQLDYDLLEYLAGFFDVSGSITIERNRYSRAKGEVQYSYPLRAELERVAVGTVDLFKNTVPGYGNNRSLPSGKVTDRWYIKARKAKLFLETLGPHFRLKAGHWKTVQEYINTSDHRPAEDSERLKEEIRKLNVSPKLSFTTPITDPYTAGVFDGHGEIDIHDQDNNLNLMAQIAMQHESFTAGIANYLATTPFPNRSHGIIKAYKVVLHSTAAAIFLKRMEPYSIKYRRLIPLALNFQKIWEQNKGKRRPDEQRAEIEAAKGLFIQTRNQIRAGSSTNRELL